MSTDDVPRSWRILRDEPSSAAWNMAVDVSLARSLRSQEGVLRIYRWARPTLSFGRNQPGRDHYDPAAARALGTEIVRRPTGGREVLHDRELTYAVVVPLRGIGRLRRTYQVINGALVAALRSLGVDARCATPGRRAPPPSAGACFREPVDGEVEVHGRKIVGSAQARIGGSLLQHGSLLLGPPTVALAALRFPPRSSQQSPSAGSEGDGHPSVGEGITLAEVLPEPVGFSRVAAAVEAAMAGALGGSWRRDELRADEREVADALLVEYESPSWTWRK